MSATSCVPRPSRIGRPRPSSRKPDRETDVVRVDLPPVRVGDRLLLVVGALDQADRRVERPQALDVGSRPAQVRLEADARPRLGRPEPLVQVDRGVGVGAALHVDPEVRACGRRVLRDPDQIGEADVGVVVEPELGRLDRDLAGDPGGDDLVDGFEVVRGDLVRFGQVREVLTEPGVHRPDPRGLERQSGREGVLERLAGHEPADGTLHEPESRQALLQPRIAGGPQEDPAHTASRSCRVGEDRASGGCSAMIGDGRTKIRFVTRFYDLDSANAVVPELNGILDVLADQRAELVRLRDEVLARGSAVVAATGTARSSRVGSIGPADAPSADELRLIRLRMQGLIDQMAAGVARIDGLGITLRDIERGLVDIPALVAGRQVWLCWQRGEPAVGLWHDLETVSRGRRPLAELG